MPAPDPASRPAPPRSSAQYGRLGRLYRWLEYLAFGRTLERSRRAFLEHLGPCSRIAVFGPGDGRCFDDLLSAAPAARFLVVERDPRFSALTRRRIERLGGLDRVEFSGDDARDLRPGPDTFDGVVTQYFLDCFSPGELDRLIPRLREGLRPGGVWVQTDFSLPSGPAFARLRARLWLLLLCTFFRVTTGHGPRELPPMEPLLEQHGLVLVAERRLSLGLVRAALYRRP